MSRVPVTVANSKEIQATKIVVINSSVPRGIGSLNARVLRRRNDRYMLPPSPQSPTLHIQRVRKAAAQGSFTVSGRVNIKRANLDYKSVKVSELAMEIFQPVPGIAHLPLEKSPSSSRRWSPTFPNIQVKRMNICRVPTFDPLDINHDSHFLQLQSLDTLPAMGLAEEDFWKLFSKCRVCLNFMTTRTISRHKCPDNSATRIGIESIPKTSALRLLDAHSFGHEAGVSEDVFKAIFYTCEQCGRYMTKRISLHHKKAAEWDDDDDSAACVYLQKQILDIAFRITG